MRVIFCSLLLISFLSIVRTVYLNECLYANAIAPVFTPFDDDMQLKLEVVLEYARFLSENGIYGVFVAGTVGEGLTLTAEETKRVLDAWIYAAKIYNLIVIIQIGGALTVMEIQELASYAEQAGANAIATLPEIYYRPTTVEQLVEFVQSIAKYAKKTPIFYVDQPEFSGVELNMVEFYKQASCVIPTFTGLFTLARTGITVLANVDLKNGQSLVAYSDMGIVPAAASEINSTISGVANIYPKFVSSMVKDAKNGDWEPAIKKQRELNRRLASITQDQDQTNSTQVIAWLKTAMVLFTDIDVGGVRDPIPKTTPKRRREIQRGFLPFTADCSS